MNKTIVKRIVDEANFIIKTQMTVRDLAKIFNVSKSTVHKDLKERLKDIDYSLFLQVDKIFKYHIDIRHIRGGESTRQKYLNLSN